MPFINRFGSASSRGYGFTSGGPGGEPVIRALQLAFGLSPTATSYNQPQGWSFVDLRSVVGSDTLITVNCGGSRGGNARDGGISGGAGAQVVGTVPTSFLAGKIIGFVNAGAQPIDSSSDGRASAGGGGFSGLIVLDPASFTIGGTLTHIISAAGGGGANGGGDQNLNLPGFNTSQIVTGSLTPSGGIITGKDPSGNTGSYPSLNYSGKNGNRFGGGDGANNSQGVDLFVSPGGGGFGPRRGVLSNGNGDPNGTSTGFSMGFGHQTPTSDNVALIGSFGGGGCGAQGASGGTPWRIISAGGGGGGFYGGNSGYGGTDGSAQRAGAGTSYCWNSANLVSHSGGSNTTGYCNLSWTIA